MQQALESAGVVFVPGNGHGPGVRLRFEWARAHKRDDGTWAVLVRWEKGAPLELAEIEDAQSAADEARRRGATDLAMGIEAAATDAIRQESPFLSEAIERLGRSRRAIASRLTEDPLTPAEKEILAREEEYMRQVLREIRVHRDAIRS